MSFLVLDNVHKIYAGPLGGLPALRGVSLEVAAGEFVAIRGPSGCGKSTLLHLVGAMDRPTSGAVRLNGQDLAALEREQLAAFRRRQIGFVFQAFHLLPTLTVAENIALPLTLDGAADSVVRPRVAQLLAEVGLSERAAHWPAQLSGGELQRVAVARAMAATPRLLLADEPTGNLDSANGLQVMRLLAELNERFGLTILLATHSPEAASFARRTVQLRDGRVEGVALHDRLSTTV